MRCEIVAIGTELLLGQIVDTNSSWIGENLALAGIDSVFQTKVGDNADRMEFCIRQALERSDAVICCGGLGPTQDDITREVIAKVMGVELRRDDAIVEKIRHMFESRNRVMADNNRRQADIPVGAEPIAQMPGTAPGLMCPVGDKVIYAVPGVPHEMRTMVNGTVLPDLQRRSGQTTAIRSRVLRTWGNSESGLAEILADRIDELDRLGNPTLAFQASGIEGIKVRITAKSPDEATADSVIASEEKLVRNLLGDVIFGVDDESMEVVVINRLRELGLTLGVIEGLTGGVVTARLSEIDAAGGVFKGSMVGGAQSHAGEPGATGEERAIATAKKAQKTFGATVGIAVSKPDMAAPPPGAPPGLVYLGVVVGDKAYSQSTALPGDRARFRNYAVISLMNFLRKILSA
ncbi:MAG: CinA family nicotinamide mononucleotide deamidase-related protein [Alphaproteobacteria bacterium]|jgi:nicotinamide-nucleotide amidase